MNPMIFIILLGTIMLGTSIVMTSSHWFLTWLGFEMNMMAVIPVLMKKYSPRSMEAATKYFLTQATASMILMLAIIINLMFSGQWTITNMDNFTASMLLTTALVMKLGLAPFHFWVPEVTQGVSLNSGLILLTWQKIAPLSLLYQIYPSINTNLLLIMSLLSIMIGGWGGLNQTQLRKIMAYSSIAHMGWMMAIMIYNPNLSLLNLFIYILMTSSMFMLLIFASTTSMLSLSLTWNKTPIITIMSLMVLLSLGGLPPLTGFMPKWMIIQELTKNNSVILPTLMAILALLNLFFYMRLTYSSALTMFPTMNNTKLTWQYQNTNILPMMMPLITMSTLALPLTPLFILLN
uniref:NADH-ubiquinone oxidoreductase chain 2 n=7 Tax=Suncus TaxID=9377 RepID=NU2M_SUNET|nr:RecName: Full=NADH-ubiquinone oxidoreductase chain 2; AltName: Full=NADH dehydrogenase subunit 2 [Suncus etruscus]ABS58654.1 NADH dehydrogenase subunit 2 [Suncus madagascariensis]AAW29763.1 NADH dehydrogenase subunit 2 [Suncus etruscus]ABS58663.1 NADH dehydrogenase subunit 2 [Suncus madagascariensis]ABS58666.1 NADH dehydrogenase subunit 2 [Suncus madagascariensis]ABS58674.1 NADH dehydrogenase subunit 2 [Suncus madagascariensis]